MKKILLSGFEPFDKSPINPSQELLNALPDELFGDVTLVKIILPVDQAHAPDLLIAKIVEQQPDAVIALGQASGRSRICLERVALNLMDFRIPDNKGISIADQPVIAGGPAAYFSTLPMREIEAALLAEGIPVELSLSAGAYLCNQVFFRMIHEIAIRQMAIYAGFIHLPALPEQAARAEKPLPSMSLDMLKRAIHLVIAVIMNTHS